MHLDINISPLDHEHCCDLLEAIAEGIVLANMLEFDAEDDEEYFPCCIKCGGFALERTDTIDGARAIVQKGRGNAFALVCYQVAKIRIDNDGRADVIVEHVERDGRVIEGHFCPKIRYGDGTIVDPLDHLVPKRNAQPPGEEAGSCGCKVVL